MHDFSVIINSVKFTKKHPYTLVFIGTCSHSNDREFTLRYTGSELFNESSVAIPTDILEQLREALREDFGHGIFDIKEARKQLKAKHAYYFDYTYTK